MSPPLSRRWARHGKVSRLLDVHELSSQKQQSLAKRHWDDFYRYYFSKGRDGQIEIFLQARSYRLAATICFQHYRRAYIDLLCGCEDESLARSGSGCVIRGGKIFRHPEDSSVPSRSLSPYRADLRPPQTPGFPVAVACRPKDTMSGIRVAIDHRIKTNEGGQI